LWSTNSPNARSAPSNEPAAPSNSPARFGITLLFCDLKDFTAYAEVRGDAAAILAIERFFEVVNRERGSHGELVKSLGDGAMLAYGEPNEAVDAGLRIIGAMDEPNLPRVHASVHRGIAIARSGDYFGGAVKLAARLLPLSAAGELVATEAVVDTCADRFAWQLVGDVQLRGVASPVVVHRLIGTA